MSVVNYMSIKLGNKTNSGDGYITEYSKKKKKNSLLSMSKLYGMWIKSQ